MVISLILDTDLGDDVDDAFALAFAIRHPQIDVRAITTVLGDTQWRAALVLRVLDDLKTSGIPVAAGAPRGERREPTRSGDVLLPLGSDDPRRDPRPAWDLMADVLAHETHPIWLVTIGPATNAARLIAARPESAQRLAGIVMMGGRHDPDNMWEHNFSSNPEAASTVCNSGLNVRVADYVISSQARLLRDDLSRIHNAPGVGPSLAMMLTTYLDRRQCDWTSMYDPAALMLALGEQYLTLDSTRMRAVVLDGQVEFQATAEGPAGFRIASTIKAEAVRESLLQVIEQPTPRASELQ